MELSKEHLQNLRQEYKNASLDENDLNKNPISQFKNWFSEAIDAKIYEPNVMTLATSNAEGKTSARIVLLKEVLEQGFVFYTNYNSQKGKAMAENNQVALVFFWAELERQVRIEGFSEKIPEVDAENYFKSRPKSSQLGALASNQSSKIKDRKSLEAKFESLHQEFAFKDIPKPAHWGGYLVRPYLIEYWQGRPSRLHDRICFEMVENQWTMNRLEP